MEDLNDFISENNILWFEDNDIDKKDIISKMSEVLIDKGYVKQSYKKAVLEREKIYPTGLTNGKYGVAIPHTDSEHVNKAGIAVGILHSPVKFEEMGSESGELIDINLVFLLAIKDPSKQLSILQDLISLISDQDKIESILQSHNSNEIINLINIWG